MENEPGSASVNTIQMVLIAKSVYRFTMTLRGVEPRRRMSTNANVSQLLA